MTGPATHAVFELGKPKGEPGGWHKVSEHRSLDAAKTAAAKRAAKSDALPVMVLPINPERLE